MPVTHRRPARTSKPAPAADTNVTPQQAAPTHDPTPEREEIAKMAYSYWEERGGQGGSEEEDWLRAEAEYRRRRA